MIFFIFLEIAQIISVMSVCYLGRSRLKRRSKVNYHLWGKLIKVQNSVLMQYDNHIDRISLKVYTLQIISILHACTIHCVVSTCHLHVTTGHLHVSTNHLRSLDHLQVATHHQQVSMNAFYMSADATF